MKSPRSHKKIQSAAKSNRLFQESALAVLRKHHNWVYELQIKYNVAFVVLYRTKSKGINTIAYDGSQLPKERKTPCWIVTILPGGEVVKKKKGLDNLSGCLRFSPKYVAPDKDLAGLLNIAETGRRLESPQSYAATKTWLEHYQLWEKVTVMYCVSLLPRKLHVNWIHGDSTFLLEAYLGPDRKLTFAPYKPKVSQRPVSLKTLHLSPPVQVPLYSPSKNAQNMSGAVSTQLQGLTSAHFLGLISQKKLLKLASQKLNTAYGALWIHLDDAENIRHVAYSDSRLDGCKNFEIFPPQLEDGPNASQHLSWNKFFNFLWQRHLALCDIKRVHLSRLLRHLTRQFKQGQELTSKQLTCLKQLQKFVSKTRIILFSNRDTELHAFKLPFAKFVAEKKKKNSTTSLGLRTNDKNTIVSLVCSFMQIDNIAPFFAVTPQSTDSQQEQPDVEFLKTAGGWLPPKHMYSVNPFLPISSERSRLDKQKAVSNAGHEPAETLLEYVHVRGRLLVNMLHSLFEHFCMYILGKFKIDLHTWPSLTSLTSLSFQVVWLRYTMLGGPLVHAPEKTKPFYDQLLRSHSRGGFSWSFAGQIQSGDVLNGTGEKAQTICELDICSSYGFAASQMACPGGFCLGFLDNPDAGVKCLNRSDNIRHKRFEFRGTYKFIHELMLSGGAGEGRKGGAANIVAVYSNYHPLGIFYLGKYPVDLCIITKNAGNFLVQFDHMYTHGCTHGCPGCYKYAGNKTRDEIQAQTQTRNQAIQGWVDRVNKGNSCGHIRNQFYTYVVVSECHTPGYSTKELDESFQVGRPLHCLIAPYLALPFQTLAAEKQQLHRLPPTLTYIIFCQGQLTDPQGRLFVWTEEGKQDFSPATLPGKEVMLTRAHYEYLCREHNFQLNSVQAILFYKTDFVLPKVFEELTKDRYSALQHSASRISVIKCLINFACGYFGYNANKKKGPNANKKWLVTGINLRRPSVGMFALAYAGDFNRQTFYTKTQMAQLPRRTGRTAKPLLFAKSNNAALPIFCTIIDLGKLRLAQCFLFIQRVTRPGSVQLLYTHIDNMILATSQPRLEQLVDSAQQTYYREHRDQFFVPADAAVPSPGQLKLEFNLSGHEWKFASPYSCFYGLIGGSEDKEQNVKEEKEDQKSFSKTSGLNNLSPAESYRCAVNLLRQVPVTLTQQRRVDKTANTQMQTVQVHMKGNK